MRLLKKVSGLSERYADTKKIIVLLVMFVLIQIAMSSRPIGFEAFQKYSNGAGILDSKFSYDTEQVGNLLDTIGKAGRQVYAGILGLDFIFIVIMYFLLSFLNTVFLRSLKVKKSLMLLNVLPAASALFDITENLFFLTFLMTYPGNIAAASGIASLITSLKWIFYVLNMALTAYLGVFTAYRSITSKRRRDKEQTL